MLVTGGFAFFIMCVIFGCGFWWGYRKGHVNGEQVGRGKGFLLQNEIVESRVRKYYPEKVEEMLLKLLG